MTDWEPAAELNRLEADYQRGALSVDDYQRFRTRLLGGSAQPVVLPSPEAAPVFVPQLARAELASWGRRVAAKFVDFFLYVLVGVVVYLATAPSAETTADTAPPSGVVLVFFALGVLYPWLMIGRFGQTLGKMALGIKVVRAEHRDRVSYARALGRVASESALGVLSLPLLLSYLWPLWDERKQTLHDKIVGTIVVRL